MNGCIIEFEIFKCGDVEEASSSDGFLYRFESAVGNVSYYVCEKAPRCPAKVLICHDARGILLNTHVGHEAYRVDDTTIVTTESEVKTENAVLYPDLQSEIEELRQSEKTKQTLDDVAEEKKEGICVLKISFPRDSPFRKTWKFDIGKPPTLEEMIKEVYKEHSSSFNDDPVVRAAVLDWFPNSEEVLTVDVSQHVTEWSRYEFLFFCDNRAVEKSLIIKGSTQKALASVTLLIDDCDFIIEKNVTFDLNSPVNLYEALQCYFNDHILYKDSVKSDVVEGIIYKFSTLDNDFVEIDDTVEFFEDEGKYKFVYFNYNAPPTAYIVYERIRTMDYATDVPLAAVVDNNNYAKRTNNAFSDDPRPDFAPELRMTCPNKCTNQHREWRCFECRKFVLYDEHKRFYCDCGGWNAASTSFKCSSHLHSASFTQFENLALLKNSVKGSSSPIPEAQSAWRRSAGESAQRRASDRTRRSRTGNVFRNISRVASSISTEVKNVFW